jgi:hypothetical protein
MNFDDFYKETYPVMRCPQSNSTAGLFVSCENIYIVLYRNELKSRNKIITTLVRVLH